MLPSIDRGNKVTCRKPFCEKNSKQRRETAEEGHFCGRSWPVKPVLKTGTSGVERAMSPSSKLGVSSGSEEEGGWEKEVRKNLISNVYIVRVCSLKVTTVKNGFDAKKV